MKTLKDLDDAAVSLGCKPPYPFLQPVPMHEGGQKRILLFAELSPIPSTRFHLSVLESITDACDQLNISLEVRSLRRGEQPMAAVVARVLKSAFPDGFIWLRVTPDQESLDVISRYSPRIPSVLLHASRLQYPSPVVAHVVPNHSAIRGAVVQWVRGLSQQFGRNCRVAVVAMTPDRVDSPFPPVAPEISENIREERIASIASALQSCGVAAQVVSVSDYSASQAASVLAVIPNAAGYICLSDEIAVGISQLLTARSEDPTSRVMGFDGSALAKEHQIPSFDQQLHRLGHEVVMPFVKWFRNGLQPGSSWPEFREIPVLVNPPSI